MVAVGTKALTALGKSEDYLTVLAKASTCAAVGIDRAAPLVDTANEDAIEALCNDNWGDCCAIMTAKKYPVKVFPAAVVSTTGTS